MQQFDDHLRRAEARPAGSGANPAGRGYAGKQKLAFDLLTSARVREAFDLSREPDRLRQRYGPTLFGNTTLLARRLVERGVRFVNVSWDNFRERFEFPPSYFVWDTHERNFPILRDNHLPTLDQTYSALMEDLDGRGLLDETLVVMMGEMGDAEAQRQRRPRSLDVLLLRRPGRGGVRGGSVYGASDAHAAYIKDRPVHIRDICATLYHCLGIDPEMPVYDHGGKPVPIAHGGRALKEVLA
jgi:hypothetical protein